MEGRNRVIIENVKPEINHGRFPVKRVINDKVKVEADIFCDGHDKVSAELLYRHVNHKDWNISGLKHILNDRWQGSFEVKEQGEYVYTLRGWVDRIKTWRHDMLKKIHAETDIKSDLLVGIKLIEEVLTTGKTVESADKQYLNEIIGLFSSSKNDEEKAKSVISGELKNILVKYPLRKFITLYNKELKVIAERPRAGFSSWYEFFPRSVSGGNNSHGTLKDCISHLDYIADMGFDVVYLPPVHPIGESKRKGKNNVPEAVPGEPGSPWAIGSKEGGHKSIHKDLGTIEDFRKLIEKAQKLHMEIAIDIALQCSPDHPYIREHPEWFKHRPDGTIQYAENPPKKYEDIYPFDFESDNWEELWEELQSIFIYWIEQGVKIFRVDNPHTKSIKFWGWLISEIHKKYPDVIFLSEAFTRPKVMYQLAKQGFTQSYTYFTWRNAKWELTKYFEELTNTEVSEYFRPNLWPNTPDILPEFLQVSGKPGFIVRAILAATLSSSYGIYGPAFELMENTPKEQGSEEYMNSEKYETKKWDLHDKKSLKSLLKSLNNIRHKNQALHNNHSLRFHETENENLIAYSKCTDDFSNIILVIVNLDPYRTHHGWVHFPVTEFEMQPNESHQVHDLLGGAYYLWNGPANYIELNPGIQPAHIFKIRRKVRTEYDFDYFM
jgi:starch synthase (maltosyl-transferring)